jgi:RNA polymerase sigma factor (sigma-70 family)
VSAKIETIISLMTMAQNSNEKVTNLVAAFQAGDVSAFSTLYDMHVNVLLNYGSKLTSDRELLKDCVHDVFVKLYVKRDELDVINNFRSYLFISLKNRIYDEFRKRVYISDTELEDAAPAMEAVEDTEVSYLTKEKEQMENLMVEKLLLQLSPRQREVLTLYYWDEKNYEDICKIMNMNYQSVRNLMHRSITKLRSLVNYA